MFKTGPTMSYRVLLSVNTSLSPPFSESLIFSAESSDCDFTTDTTKLRSEPRSRKLRITFPTPGTEMVVLNAVPAPACPAGDCWGAPEEEEL
jgi:hypothetical protein